MNIKTVVFENFKAFTDYTFHINKNNILSGPNNNGKSTILDAFRILQASLRYANSINPKIITLPNEETTYGYQIPRSSIPVSLTNVQTNYSSFPSTIKFIFDKKQVLYLIFSEGSRPILYYETHNRKIPKTRKEFKIEFDIKISVLPTLGPFEVNEDIITIDHTKRWWGSRRSSRMFRNIWYHLPERFEEFKNLVESTWPGMTICKPEKLDIFSKELIMFCEENLIKREISWVGFGFQVWLQLLTHIAKSVDSDILIVDEPEIYLHPDLQHKIINIFKSYSYTTILATHSIEIINDADPADVVLVDKSKSQARRIADLKGLQEVATILGSGSNIHLTRLARGKKILFVEGEDLKMLKKLASVANYDNLFSSQEITVIPINGFSNYEKIINANWAFSKVLGQELKISVLLDRDYRCEEETSNIKNLISQNVHYVNILNRKELENYLLIPDAIKKSIEDRIKAKHIISAENYTIPEIDINKILDQVTEKHRTHTHGQITASSMLYHQKLGIAPGTAISLATEKFDALWFDLETRLHLVPGKLVLSDINSFIQDNYKVSITSSLIISKLRKTDIANDLVSFFYNLDKFRIDS